ncbi:MAG: SdrD B-like domain-containing protein, partial [Saprospiraceae bacterium]
TTLLATTNLLTTATCLVGGSATVSASGGTPPYTYHWDNGQATATATGLTSGTHSVTVTDASGCIATATIFIGQSQGPNVTITVNTSATCTSGGSATATAIGTGPFTYLWDNGQTTATATNLSPGVHGVTVTDQAGCAGSATTTITQTGVPTAVISSSSGAACITGGSATAGATGGTPPYTFHWSNGVNTATVTNLSAGSYTVTITDAAGCTATATVSIAAALPPNVVITASSNAKCDQPGSATASATNGATPYTYHWDNGETTATAVNLAAGVHTVTVTDAAGCTGTASVTIGFAANGIKIGDFVWYDISQNGHQDALEGGVANVTVMLIKPGPDGIFGNGDDVILQTTTTNSNGKYEFGCITPGTYVVMFSGIPGGYQFTKKDYVNNDCEDSDAKANGKTDPFSIVAGQGDNFCIDAGITTICDNVLNAGVICCNQTICEGDVPAPLVPVQAPSGGSGPIQYQWVQLLLTPPSPTPDWVAIPGATSASYQPGALFETSFFMRCAKRQGCFVFLESNIVTITVKPSGSPGCTSFITNITAFQQGPTTVLVNWETLPEGDDYMYTVEHSMNKNLWTSVGTVMGKHDATQHNSYSLQDKTPENGMNYYRVKRTNINGTEAFSPAVSVELKLKGEEALMITPNPVADKLYIKNVASYASDVTIQLFSTQGKLLNTLVIKQGTLQETQLPMGDLPQGIYLVRANFGDGNVKTLKITKF